MPARHCCCPWRVNRRIAFSGRTNDVIDKVRKQGNAGSVVIPREGGDGAGDPFAQQPALWPHGLHDENAGAILRHRRDMKYGPFYAGASRNRLDRVFEKFLPVHSVPDSRT